MKTKNSSIMAGVAGFFLLVFQVGAHAAPLDLNIFFNDPVFTSDGLDIVYDYQGGGSGGTLTVSGDIVTSTVQYADGVTAAISGSPAPAAISGSGYLLTANFDDLGNFLIAGSSVTISGYSVLPAGFGSTINDPFYTTLPGGPTGTILTMDLIEFGFTGEQAFSGDRDSVIFEWKADIVGGDLHTLGFDGQVGGAKTLGQVFYGSTDGTTSGSYGAAGWESLGLGDTTAFTADFASCTTGCPLQVNTFVPVPAAVWLFGTGLVALFGASRRRRTV